MSIFAGIAGFLPGLFRNSSALPTPEESAREAELKKFFLERCAHFRLLLAANKASLEGMTQLESLLSNAAQPDLSSFRTLCFDISARVKEIVDYLNALSDTAYPELPRRFHEIFTELRDSLEEQPPLVCRLDEAPLPPDFPLVLRFGTEEALHARACGPKMAGLARGALHPPLPDVRVPQGFVTTVKAFELFMEHEGLGEDITQLLHSLRVASPSKAQEKSDVNQELVRLHRISAAVRDRIMQSSLPASLEREIRGCVAELEKLRPGCSLAVRSSATDEDGAEHSFAGQYKSLLHVSPSDALHAWKEVVASLYGINVLSYKADRRLHENENCAMCVGFLVMLDVSAGGVAYSADPLDAKNSDCLVNAVAGLPGAVVDGSAMPDLFRIDPGPPPAVRACLPGKGKQALSSVSGEQALTVARLALALQAIEGCAQDVEWAFDKEGVLHLLQNRPLARSEAQENDTEVEEFLGTLPLLLSGGTTACRGLGSGPAHLVQTDRDMARFPRGGVLVVSHALPKWAPLLNKASALVSEAGGTASHLAGVAREYSLPALFGMRGIIELLRKEDAPHPSITVDARSGSVRLGALPAAFSVQTRPVPAADTPQRALVRAAADSILPLTLLDPEAENFTPSGCRTLHDITRFCHEKSVEAMFDTQLEERGEQPPGKQLKAGVKLKYWLVDMGGGFIDGVATPHIDIKDIRSLPMLALWNGMSAIPWAGPPAPDGKGFLSVLARSASNPELDPLAANSMVEKNYFLVSRTFCNLQTRIGYHFCTVEAEAGETEHANYASFHFKGGAASQDRRALRVRLMADILQEHGFTADAKRDALFAHAENASRQDILAKTRILGYLLIHTRQVDMIMRNAGMVAGLNKKLREDIRKLASMPLQLPY